MDDRGQDQDLVRDQLRRGEGDAGGADAVDVEGQVRPVLLDGADRHDRDLPGLHRVIDLRPGELGVDVRGCFGHASSSLEVMGLSLCGFAISEGFRRGLSFLLGCMQLLWLWRRAALWWPRSRKLAARLGSTEASGRCAAPVAASLGAGSGLGEERVAGEESSDEARGPGTWTPDR